MNIINLRTLNLAVAYGLGTLTASLAFAAAFMPAFKTADSNRDGVVNLREFEAQGGYEQAFGAGDANGDRRLGNDEYVKAAANSDRIRAAKYVDDAWITTKVKTLLLKDEGLKGLDVNVESHQGTVQLSGWVGTPMQATEAEKVARSVEGVKDVRNDLLIKH